MRQISLLGLIFLILFAFGSTVATATGTDTDSDGYPDESDNCPGIPNNLQEDADFDGQGDACDTDDDNDGILDGSDNCPTVDNVSQADNDSDGDGDACDENDDNDAWTDTIDNCPFVANDQTDSDSDGDGDECDSDDDNDGILDAAPDNCRTVANVSQADNDGDGDGDACDENDDNDAWTDTIDNCPFVANDQTDSDSDGSGDACDSNDDNDNHDDGSDNCPTVANNDQSDVDSDGIGDLCDSEPDGDTITGTEDNCDLARNPSQGDIDGDGVGDACDNCVYTSNASQTDSDADGVGDSCEGGGSSSGIDKAKSGGTYSGGTQLTNFTVSENNGQTERLNIDGTHGSASAAGFSSFTFDTYNTGSTDDIMPGRTNMYYFVTSNGLSIIENPTMRGSGNPPPPNFVPFIQVSTSAPAPAEHRLSWLSFQNTNGDPNSAGASVFANDGDQISDDFNTDGLFLVKYFDIADHVNDFANPVEIPLGYPTMTSGSLNGAEYGNSGTGNFDGSLVFNATGKMAIAVMKDHVHHLFYVIQNTGYTMANGDIGASNGSCMIFSFDDVLNSMGITLARTPSASGDGTTLTITLQPVVRDTGSDEGWQETLVVGGSGKNNIGGEYQLHSSTWDGAPAICLVADDHTAVVCNDSSWRSLICTF